METVEACQEFFSFDWECTTIERKAILIYCDWLRLGLGLGLGFPSSGISFWQAEVV